MSVIMVLRVPGDPAAFQQYAQANPELMERIAGAGKSAGAKHHLFAAGNNEIVVVDEWDSAEHFQSFFASQKEIPELMRAAGATGVPQVTCYNKMATPDEF